MAFARKLEFHAVRSQRAVTRLALALLVPPLAACTTSPIQGVLERAERQQKPLVLVLVHSEFDEEIEHHADTKKLIQENYYFERIHLSSAFDRAWFLDYIAQRKQSGAYSRSLTFEDFLRRKNQPLSEPEMALVKDLNLAQTPELFVLRRNGDVVARLRLGLSEVVRKRSIELMLQAETEAERKSYADVINKGYSISKNEHDAQELHEFLKNAASH